jgi:AcrR family transcriptional regulator
LSSRMNQTETQPHRPKRADARLNHDKLVAAARALFTDKGTSAPLEEVAERAGVGIGTLYRHFPTRQALFEAVYVDEVEAMARAAADLAELPPWDALSQWLHQYVGFAATKRALNEALMETDPDSNVLLTCRTAITGAGTALVERAQRAGVVRADTNFTDVVRMVGAIAMVPTEDPEQKKRLLELALDGLRYHAHDS